MSDNPTPPTKPPIERVGRDHVLIGDRVDGKLLALHAVSLWRRMGVNLQAFEIGGPDEPWEFPGYTLADLIAALLEAPDDILGQATAYAREAAFWLRESERVRAELVATYSENLKLRAEANPWRPIETAPRDGRWVEVWDPTVFNDDAGAVITVREQFGDWRGLSNEVSMPTHWRESSRGPSDG